MSTALSLAQKGKGRTGLNPAVGCVIVKNNKIIGKGYHKYFGGGHAEIEAIKNAKQSIRNSIVYVTLEPCAHFGKTPPCADELIRQKIRKIIIGMVDPNPLVKGKGIEKLKKSGIEVEFENLDKRIEFFYRDFSKYIIKKIPYIKLKAAISIDGKIALKNKVSKWISNENSRKYVHKLRNEVDAILLGINTLLTDNPKLNVRGIENPNNNFKIILDADLQFKLDSQLLKYNAPEKIIIITASKNRVLLEKLKNKKINIVQTEKDSNGYLKIKPILNRICAFGIKDILLEGGSKIYTYFLKNNLIDEIYCFVSNKIIGNDGIGLFGDLNLKKFKYNLRNIQYTILDDNILIHSIL